MLAQKFIAILALAITVSASPIASTSPTVDRKIFGDGEGNQNIGNEGQNAANTVVNTGNVNGDLTVKQSTKTCGNAQLNCCNQISKKGDTKNSNILALFSQGGDVGINCSPVNALSGIFYQLLLSS